MKYISPPNAATDGLISYRIDLDWYNEFVMTKTGLYTFIDNK